MFKTKAPSVLYLELLQFNNLIKTATVLIAVAVFLMIFIY